MEDSSERTKQTSLGGGKAPMVVDDMDDQQQRSENAFHNSNEEPNVPLLTTSHETPDVNGTDPASLSSQPQRAQPPPDDAASCWLSQEQVHEMSLTLLEAPSWRTRRRRRQSLVACATDVGQRFHQATVDLLQHVCSYLEEDDQHNKNTEWTISVTALSWLLLLLQASDHPNNNNDDSPNKDESYGHILLHHHYYYHPSAPEGGRMVRQHVQRLRDLILSSPSSTGTRRRWSRLHVTRSATVSTNNNNDSKNNHKPTSRMHPPSTRLSPKVWPPSTTHRDLSWSLAPFLPNQEPPHSSNNNNNDDDDDDRKTLAAKQWLQAYLHWQAHPHLGPRFPQESSATTTGPAARVFLSRITAWWLDQIPSSSFAGRSVPAVAPSIQVLRLERTSLEDCFSSSGDWTTDLFQQQQPQALWNQPTTLISTEDDPLAAPSIPTPPRVTLYPKLVHLQITHCSLPLIHPDDDENNNKKEEERHVVWSHFPALESLRLSHNALGGQLQASAPNPSPPEQRPSNTTVTTIPLLEGLSVLTRLQKLDLSYNNLSSFHLQRIHCQVGNIVEVNLSNNGLTSCTGVDRLYSVERLWLHHNQLTDLASVRGLACLPQLTSLTLYGNPLAHLKTTLSSKLATTTTKTSTTTSSRRQGRSVFLSRVGTTTTTTSAHNHNHNNSKTKQLALSSSYRLALLDLFWQARGSHGHDDDDTDNSLLSLRLDGNVVSRQELTAVRSMAFGSKLVAPEYHRPHPQDDDDDNNLHINNDKEEEDPTGVLQDSQPERTRTTTTEGIRRRRRPVKILEPSHVNNHKRKRKLQHSTNLPPLKFDAVDILQTLCRPLLITDDPAVHEKEKEEETRNPQAPAVVTEDEREEKESLSLSESDTNGDNPVEKASSNTDSDAVAMTENPKSTVSSGEKEVTVSQDDMKTSVAVVKTDSSPLTNGSESAKDLDSKPKAVEEASHSALATAPAGSLVPETMSKLHETSSEGNEENNIPEETQVTQNAQADSSQTTLSMSPPRKKKGSVMLHNKSTPTRDLDTSKISNASDSSFLGEGSRTDEISIDSTRNAMLSSAMLMTVTSSEQHPWSRSGEHDCNSSAPGSVAHSQVDEQTKFAMAEKNSTFVGPHTYKQITIHDNLDIYFRMFVFSTAVGPTSSNALFFDPEEVIWQHVLENFPRIQLWPVDRRIQEAEAAKNMGPTGPSAQEEFRRVWQEWVVGCGKPALKRLTPVRTPRLGFHGELVYPPSSTLDVAAGVANSSSPNNRVGRPETVTKERKAVLCASTVAFYVIVDHDTDLMSRAMSTTKPSRKAFPKPIPMDACFAEAFWPHALARHPWTHLRAITIGFNFQRLSLRFVQPNTTNSKAKNAPNDSEDSEFCYILLTCNKLQTVSLLKEFQDLTDNIAVAFDSPGAINHVAIDNDDPVVLDGLSNTAYHNSFGAVCHFQILHQYWKNGDRGLVRRLCVVTDSRIYLFDENYCGDGSYDTGAVESSNGEWGKPQYFPVDEASLVQVLTVQAATSDPCSLTISITPASRLSRTHNWRLICKDREGAERLIEDVRKAVNMAKAGA